MGGSKEAASSSRHREEPRRAAPSRPGGRLTIGHGEAYVGWSPAVPLYLTARKLRPLALRRLRDQKQHAHPQQFSIHIALDIPAGHDRRAPRIDELRQNLIHRPYAVYRPFA